MLSATPNEGQYSGNTLNVDLGGGGQAYIYIYTCICVHACTWTYREQCRFDGQGV